MYILRVVIFSLDEPNLTRILTVFKGNLVKYKGRRTSREYTFILFLILVHCFTNLFTFLSISFKMTLHQKILKYSEYLRHF